MADYVKASDIPRASLHNDPSIAWPTLFEISRGDRDAPDPLLQFDTLDALDPKFTRALAITASQGSVKFYGEPLSTVAYTAYGKTSGWWMILVYNGYMHPDEIPLGSTLNIPDLVSFKTAYNARASKAQRIITF